MRKLTPKVFFAWLILAIGVFGVAFHLAPAPQTSSLSADAAYAALALVYWLEVAVGHD